MLKIEEKIYDIDNVICENLNMLDSTMVTRDIISQNLLAQSRNLVEHIAVRAYGGGKEIAINRDTVPRALAYLKEDNKYLFLRKFHSFLQESKSHYTPDNEGAERLMIKYYQFFAMIRNFAKYEYGMELLSNLEKFPLNTDRTVEEFREKIAELLKEKRNFVDYSRTERMYVHKVIPFIVDGVPYYEMVLTPAYDSTSKFDRFIVYSENMLPSHYAIKAAIFYEDIEVNGKKMPVNILTEFSVSIRPCEFNNFADLFDEKIRMTTGSAEYIGMMKYLSYSGASLLDVVLSSESDYIRYKNVMFGRSKAKHFEPVLDSARCLILAGKPGSNVIRYLLHTMNNKVLKLQKDKDYNSVLSGLRLKWGCIPFDEMPFATSLIRHNPETIDLFESIDQSGREHEFMAKYIKNNMNTNSKLYTPIKELEGFTNDIDAAIDTFNRNIHIKKHEGRKLAKFGQSVYVKGAFDNTKYIIEELMRVSESGILGYTNAISAWMDENQAIDSEEKKAILQRLFERTHVAMIYGAAGTGKTYMINQVSQFLDSHSKLYLANTNPAVENLRRNVMAQNCKFMTIRKYIQTKNVPVDVDILIMDECSMVSNSDMADVLRKINCKVMLLVGDTYQIESIDFGNWFSMAKYFIPRYAWYELETPYRTKDEDLLTLWKKVRKLDEDLTEHIVANRYASNLGASVFDKKSEEEIILCLNYDGLYGINNINRFLQENNPNLKYNSGCLSRQVGAIVTDSNFSVKSVGWNDVPNKQLECIYRDVHGYCKGNQRECYSQFEYDNETLKKIFEHLDKEISKVDLHGRKFSYCFKDIYNGWKGDKNQVFTRALHAEENAFLQISKYGGMGIEGGNLFCTASPCELCSKKAFQLGIKKIYYIDPYPGIAQTHILRFGKGKGNPELHLFSGAIGEAYVRLYRPMLAQKDELELVTGINSKAEVRSIIDTSSRKTSAKDLKYKLMEVSLEFVSRESIESIRKVDLEVLDGEFDVLERSITWTGSSYDKSELIDDGDKFTLEDSKDQVSPYHYKINLNNKFCKGQRISYGIKTYLKDESQLMHEYLAQIVKYPIENLILRVIIPEKNALLDNVRYVRYADMKMEYEFLDQENKVTETKKDNKIIYELQIENPNLFYTYSMEWDFIKVKS